MTESRRMLDLAARLGYRAWGNVEPNPCVGCVIVKDGAIIGMGHHRWFGDLHAEADALADCKRRGHDPAGATVYVTLEPCNHTGKQPPCSQALIAAGVGRVVCARRDPNPVSAGGADALGVAGITVEFTNTSRAAVRLSDAFCKRISTGLPWVIAKWAQTIDGRVATRTGESKWISNEWSRAIVHRVRSRVDAIVTGIGTVLADNPMLTARGPGAVHVRRKARRVVIDPMLEISVESNLVASAFNAPVTVVCTDDAATQSGSKFGALMDRGVDMLRIGFGGEMDVRKILKYLVETHEVTTVLIESGPGLLGRMIDADLIDEALVFVAPMMLADEQAKPAARGRVAEALADAKRFSLQHVKRVGGDVMLDYRRPLA